MPRYTYCCRECGITFQKAHSIKERLTDCEDCETEGVLERVPSMPFVFSEKKKAGDLVKQHIEETRQDIKEEKESLQKVEYE